MSKSAKKRVTIEQAAKRAESRVRKLRADTEAAYLKSQLSYYTGADKGRRSRDWKSTPFSADAALIPELGTLVARSRIAIANTWIGKSAKRAHVRNMVGRGIEVVPVARDESENELADLNKLVAKLWADWAGTKEACHVQKRSTFWSIQRQTASEDFAAGTVFIMWSYRPNPDYVGLQLQFAEVEQLDNTKSSFNGNEVRGGVERDCDGAAIAFHFYDRNPNDYGSIYGLESKRVPASSVFTYINPDRISQTLGEPVLACVLRDIKDFSSYTEAMLYRARMEACIGFGIKKNTPTTAGPLTLPLRSGDSGTTASGMRTFDFVPGMVPELMPGEDLVPFIPQTPGSNFEPYTTRMLRAIGSAIGQSYGALTRHNDANYSAARQDMLEDEREIEPYQDALIDQLILPIYELFFRLACIEGRLPLSYDQFILDPKRYVEAEYIPPARPWIDPEKEVNAFEKALELRIITRKEIVAQRGYRLATILKQIADERDEAAEVDIEFPEDKAPAPMVGPDGQPIQQKDGGFPPGKAKDKPPKEDASDDKPLSVLAPNYRPLNDPVLNCARCKWFAGGNHCGAYNFMVTPGSVCDAFEAGPMQTATPHKPGNNPRPDGDKPIEDISARDNV